LPKAPRLTPASHVTQLALLLALSLLGSVLSFGFGRLEVKRGGVSGTVKRAEGALERASLAILRLSGGRGLVLQLVPALGLSLFALLGAGGSVSGVGRAAFVCVSLLVGAASALLQARFALGLGARAASSAAAARARGSSRALRPLLRAAVAITLFGDGLGLLGLAGAFASLYAIRGGFAAPQPNAQLAAEVVRLLPAFALGAAVTALALAREGSVAASAARVGGSQAAPWDSTPQGDARDPALLAQLMGGLVGELLPSALVGYVAGLVVTVGAAALAVSGAAPGVNTLACLVLVVLVRAFGAVAAVCGVFAASVTDDEHPTRALTRGQVSAVVVAAFGLGAALFWLEREQLAALFVAATLGLLTTAIVSRATARPFRLRAPREAPDSLNAGDAAVIVRSVGKSFSRLAPALLTPALAVALLEHWLAAHVATGLLWLSFVTGALALLPFGQALLGFALLSEHTRGVAALARLELERARASKLDEASSQGKLTGSTQGSLVLALGLLLGLLSLASNAGTSSSNLGPVAVSVGLGGLLVLFFGSRAAQSAVGGARLVATEAERQWLEQSRNSSSAAEATPSYKPCVEAAFSAAQGGSVLELGVLLLCPFLFAALLRVASGVGAPATLGTFGVAAVAAGLIFTLGARATRALLRETRLRAQQRELGSGSAAAPQAESLGDLVGVTAATSSEALALVLALTVLCLAPLLR